MATQIKISELPLASEDALSLASDDRFIFNNDNVNTQTIKFANLVDAILEQNLTFTGNCSFTQPITGPNGGDVQVGLDDLVDVQFQNIQSGQIITYSGTQWINKDVKDIALQLDSLSVDTAATPSGGGALAYDNATGTFTFTPANVGTFTASSLSVVVSNAPSGGGNLVYNPANSVFTFTPADAYTKAENYSSAEVDGLLANKANTSDTYTKTEVDNALGSKALADVVGVTGTDTNLGQFIGSTIQDNQNVKQALQQLETALEAQAGSTVALDDFSVVTGAASGGGTLAYNDAGAFTFQPADLTSYATTASVNTAIGNVTGANLSLANQNTGDLAEGTNLYYTEARADARAQNAVNTNNANYISLADLKTLVAGAGDYEAFKTAIASFSN